MCQSLTDTLALETYYASESTMEYLVRLKVDHDSC